jgi:hypothetical protein
LRVLIALSNNSLEDSVGGTCSCATYQHPYPLEIVATQNTKGHAHLQLDYSIV